MAGQRAAAVIKLFSEHLHYTQVLVYVCMCVCMYVCVCSSCMYDHVDGDSGSQARNKRVSSQEFLPICLIATQQQVCVGVCICSMYVCMYVWKNGIHGDVCYVVALWRSFPVLLSSPTFLGSMSSRFVYILTYIHTCVFTEIHTYISYTYITIYLAHEHILHIHTYAYIDSYIHVLVCT